MTAPPAGSPSSAGPALAGLRVLDVSTLFAGPMAATMLGDFGADVVKVEHPRGDPVRTHGASKDGVGLWGKVVGRNKRGITLNLSDAAGQEVFRRLAAGADVVIENFRPGTLERWGVGPEDLFARNPGLVLAIDGPELDAFVQAAGAALTDSQPATMLSPGIHASFEKGVEALATMPSLDELRARLVGMINTPVSPVGEVGEAAVVQLVGDGDRARRTVAVLGQDEVRLARAGVVALERVGPVKKNHHVSVLLDRIVENDAIGQKIFRSWHRGVKNCLLAEALHLDNLVPEDVVRGEHVQLGVVQHGSSSRQA